MIIAIVVGKIWHGFSITDTAVRVSGWGLQTMRKVAKNSGPKPPLDHSPKERKNIVVYLEVNL